MPAVLTSLGEEWIVDKLDETTQESDEWIALGTSTNAASKGDAALGSESTEHSQPDRAEGTISQPSADKHRIVGTTTMDVADDIGEGGNFTSSTTGGDLIVHGEFSAIAVSSGDKIELTVDLEIT